MFYLVMGYINGAEITIASILVSFVVVTIGNFIGGALIVTGAHYFIET
jgi:formate/nitrite transporter FocA (FNT family)